MEYGLIGGRLGHSYSKPITRGWRLRLPPVPAAYAEEAHAFMRARDFKAINVTILIRSL
jgi:shikimate dehydrogenase